MKAMLPTSPVTTLTGISSGAMTIRAAISARFNGTAPASAQSGMTRTLSVPAASG